MIKLTPKSKIIEWNKLIEQYLITRSRLQRAFILIDATTVDDIVLIARTIKITLMNLSRSLYFPINKII